MAFLLTRRDFLQAMAATGSLLFGGLGTASAGHVAGKDAVVVHCLKCTAVNKFSSLASKLPSDGIVRCRNCGADLSGRYSSNEFPDLGLHEVVPSDRYPVTSDSRYIPFPSHQYLLNAAKPKLEVAKLLF